MDFKPLELALKVALIRAPHVMNTPQAKPQLRLPNWALAGLLAALVGGTYFSSFTRVSKDDLQRELERELQEEAAKQQRANQ